MFISHNDGNQHVVPYKMGELGLPLLMYGALASVNLAKISTSGDRIEVSYPGYFVRGV